MRSPFEFIAAAGVVPPGSISNAELADMAALTVKANPTNALGVPQDVPATADGQVFQRNGNTLDFSPLRFINKNTAAVPTAPITTALQVVEADGNFSSLGMFSFANSPIFYGARAGGTNAVKTAIGVNDNIFALLGYGYNGANYINTAQMRCRAAQAFTVGNNGTYIDFLTTPNGSATPAVRWRMDDDGSFTSTANTKQGDGTVNATGLFVNNVNINTTFARLAAANSFTLPQTISTPTTGVTLGTASLNLVSADPANFGAGIFAFHNSVSPAVNDIPFILVATGNNSAAATINYGTFFCIADNVTAGAEAAHWQYNSVIAGGVAARFSIGDGVWGGSVAGNGMGNGSANMLAYYVSGTVAIDTNGLLRARPFTVGTLPAAAGVVGAKARVTDSLAAPVFAAAAVGGGVVYAPVESDGTTWRYY